MNPQLKKVFEAFFKCLTEEDKIELQQNVEPTTEQLKIFSKAIKTSRGQILLSNATQLFSELSAMFLKNQKDGIENIIPSSSSKEDVQDIENIEKASTIRSSSPEKSINIEYPESPHQDINEPSPLSRGVKRRVSFMEPNDDSYLYFDDDEPCSSISENRPTTSTPASVRTSPRKSNLKKHTLKISILKSKIKKADAAPVLSSQTSTRKRKHRRQSKTADSKKLIVLKESKPISPQKISKIPKIESTEPKIPRALKCLLFSEGADEAKGNKIKPFKPEELPEICYLDPPYESSSDSTDDESSSNSSSDSDEFE